jgi:lipopolysaccharide export LptBFGC system permease protein LptF
LEYNSNIGENKLATYAYEWRIWIGTRYIVQLWNEIQQYIWINYGEIQTNLGKMRNVWNVKENKRKKWITAAKRERKVKDNKRIRERERERKKERERERERIQINKWYGIWRKNDKLKRSLQGNKKEDSLHYGFFSFCWTQQSWWKSRGEFSFESV